MLATTSSSTWTQNLANTASGWATLSKMHMPTLFNGPRSQDIWSSWDGAAGEVGTRKWDSLQFLRHFLAPHDSIIFIVYCRGWPFSTSEFSTFRVSLSSHQYCIINEFRFVSHPLVLLLVVDIRELDSTEPPDSKKFWVTWQVLLFVSEFLSAALPHTKIVCCILNLEIEVRILKSLKFIFSSQHWDEFQVYFIFWLRAPYFVTDLYSSRWLE